LAVSGVKAGGYSLLHTPTADPLAAVLAVPAADPAAAGAIASIFAIDDRLIRTSVEPGGGLVDALNPQPPPTEKQVSAFISVVDCGINVPGSVCNSR